nr:ribosomal RNA small subunit methyltransferase NEP1 [Paratrimastix eleionoma]
MEAPEPEQKTVEPDKVPPEKKIYVVLENANLEVGKIKDGYHLLSCDDHVGLIKKNKKNIADYRPDITHQCLLTLLDSPLNKTGHLKVFIHTASNVLIEVNPKMRVPRTYKRFAGLMVQLLHKLKIRSPEGETLLRVIRNPVEAQLPPGCRKYSTSCLDAKLVDMFDFAGSLPKDVPCCFVIGAMAHGHIHPDFTEETIAVSPMPLSASIVCGRVCSSFERVYGVL